MRRIFLEDFLSMFSYNISYYDKHEKNKWIELIRSTDMQKDYIKEIGAVLPAAKQPRLLSLE